MELVWTRESEERGGKLGPFRPFVSTLSINMEMKGCEHDDDGSDYAIAPSNGPPSLIAN